VAAVVVGAPCIAAADPPGPLNVNALPPVQLPEYSVMNDVWYAFTAPGGVVCAIQRRDGGYGCSGSIPGAPQEANFLSADAFGAPVFAHANADVFGSTGAKPLPPNTRLSYRTVSCGTDGVVTTCLNTRSQSGFVISPAGSYVFGETPPLLDRPEGKRPY
jgi:hypothetical protein